MKHLKDIINESKNTIKFSLSADDIEFLKDCFDDYGYVNLAIDLDNGKIDGIEVNIDGKWQMLNK